MTKHGFKAALLLAIVAIATSCNPYGNKAGKAHGFNTYSLGQASADTQTEAGAQEETETPTATTADGGSASTDYGLPALRNNSGEIILRRKGYTASYNPATRIPNWVAWHLTASHTSGTAKRNGMKFQEDYDVPEPRANTYDYTQSGYDRGHMCPAGDNKWSPTAMEQSFLLSNACPQNRNLNAGGWNSLEQQCRTWANDYGDIYIVSGPILFNQKHKTIGKHKVTVPEAFFKVILCMRDTPKAIGFIYRNAPGAHQRSDYVNTVDQVERITGLDFFAALPDDIENKVEAHADLGEWE